MDPLWSQWTLSSAEGCHETTSFQSPKKRKISFHSCKSNFSGSSSSIGNDVMLCISQLGLKTYDIAFYAPNISWDCFMKKWSFVSKIVQTYCEKFFEIRKLKVENLQNFWDHYNNLLEQWKVSTIFETEFSHVSQI